MFNAMKTGFGHAVGFILGWAVTAALITKFGEKADENKQTESDNVQKHDFADVN